MHACLVHAGSQELTQLAALFVVLNQSKRMHVYAHALEAQSMRMQMQAIA
jgi:hypothetical protein